MPEGLRLRLGQLMAVFSVSLRLNVRSKRLWTLLLVAALPVIPPLIVLILNTVFGHSIPMGRGAMLTFKNFVGIAYFHFLLYIIALVSGLAVVSDEVEGKTLVHLMLRPLPKWVLVVGRYLAGWVVAAAILVASLVLNYALIWAVRLDADTRHLAFNAANLKVLGFNAMCLAFALAAYMSLFSAFGAWLPHGERFGIVFCFGWEWLITYLPARLKWFTVMYHVQTICPHEMAGGRLARLLTLQGEPLSKTTCTIVLICIIVAGLALTIRNLKTREWR